MTASATARSIHTHINTQKNTRPMAGEGTPLPIRLDSPTFGARHASPRIPIRSTPMLVDKNHGRGLKTQSSIIVAASQGRNSLPASVQTAPSLTVCHCSPHRSGSQTAWPWESSSSRVALVASHWEDPVQAVLAGSQVASGTHAGIYLRPSDIGCQYSGSTYTARFEWQPRRATDTSTNWQQNLFCVLHRLYASMYSNAETKLSTLGLLTTINGDFDDRRNENDAREILWQYSYKQVRNCSFLWLSLVLRHHLSHKTTTFCTQKNVVNRREQLSLPPQLYNHLINTINTFNYTTLLILW